MALTTRPRPKVQHRKRQAKHHKHTPNYLKTYWPYLPMFAVLGLGFMLNDWLNQSAWLSSRASVSLNGLDTPTRIEAMTGNNTGLSLAIVVILAAGAMAIFLFRNWFRVQRTLNRGEAFMVKHPWVDVGLLLLITAGVLLTRQAI